MIDWLKGQANFLKWNYFEGVENEWVGDGGKPLGAVVGSEVTFHKRKSTPSTNWLFVDSSLLHFCPFLFFSYLLAFFVCFCCCFVIFSCLNYFLESKCEGPNKAFMWEKKPKKVAFICWQVFLRIFLFCFYFFIFFIFFFVCVFSREFPFICLGAEAGMI